MGLPAQRWLDVDTDFGSDNLMVKRPAPADKPAASASKSNASPR
jgi:beta-lactamase class C